MALEVLRVGWLSCDAALGLWWLGGQGSHPSMPCACLVQSHLVSDLHPTFTASRQPPHNPHSIAGEWFYHYALGLHHVYASPASIAQSTSGHANADAGAQKRKLSKCIAQTGLSRQHLGGLMADVDAVCALASVVTGVKARRASGEAVSDLYHVSQLKRATRSALASIRNGDRSSGTVSSNSRPKLVSTARIVLDPHIVRALGSADGHIDTQTGRVDASWSWVAGEDSACSSLGLTFSTPAGSVGAVFLPIELLKNDACGDGAVTVQAPHSSAAPGTIRLSDLTESSAAGTSSVNGASFSLVSAAEAFDHDLAGVAAGDDAAAQAYLRIDLADAGRWSFSA